jgi:proteic killer suppression protein
MIKSFNCKETEKIFNSIFSKKLPHDIQRRAMIKLHMIDTAEDITDLRVPPANFLEQLQGDRAGQYSIRINQQYRICFIWNNNNAYDVEIVDYH